MDKSIKIKLLWVFIFAVAMGVLESVVVVYLRYMFYPNGFKFPLTAIPNSLIIAELVRELCTIVMLLSISWIAGKNRTQIFSFFLFSFAVWDIFYYVGLKLFLDWPQSFFTWDILFLIPVPWVGPVLAPAISSLSMIILSLIMLTGDHHNCKFKILEWLLIYIGAALIFVSFIWDYTGMILTGKLNSDTLDQITARYIPEYYHWDLFILGTVIIYLSILLMIKRTGLFLNWRNKSRE